MSEMTAERWLFEKQPFLDDRSHADLILIIVKQELDALVIEAAAAEAAARRKSFIRWVGTILSVILSVIALAKAMGIF